MHIFEVAGIIAGKVTGIIAATYFIKKKRNGANHFAKLIGEWRICLSTLSFHASGFKAVFFAKPASCRFTLRSLRLLVPQKSFKSSLF